MENEIQVQNREPLRRPVNPIAQQQEEKRERINKVMGAMLIITAICIDLFQALLTLLVVGVVLSPIISIVATVLFWIWYKILGISFISNPKRLATFATTAWLEILPLADIVPVWTIGTIITVMITRSEDKGGILGKAANVAQGKIK